MESTTLRERHQHPHALTLELQARGSCSRRWLGPCPPSAATNSHIGLVSRMWVVHGEFDQVAHVRALVAAALPNGPVAREDVTLVAGELAANAIEHSRSNERDFAVELTVADTLVELAVHDAGADNVPQLLNPPAPDHWLNIGEGINPEAGERGRGLRLVRAYADTWGYTGDDGGTTVWARFDVCPLQETGHGSDFAGPGGIIQPGLVEPACHRVDSQRAAQ